MPDLVPKALHEPPLWSDRVLIHAIHVAVCVWWIVYSAQVIIGMHMGYGSLADSIGVLHPIVLIAMAGMITVGSLVTLWGILTPNRRLDRAWRAHQAGQVLSGFGWGVFTIAYVAAPGNYWFATTTGVFQILIAAAGFTAALFVERTSRETLRSQGLDA